MSWSDFLAYLSQPSGIAAVVGVLWSIAVEYWPVFGTLEPKWKRATFFGLSLVVPLAAFGLAVLTGVKTYDSFDSLWTGGLWPAAVSGALAFASGTALHWKVKGIRELE